jgi:hypothetical protein
MHEVGVLTWLKLLDSWTNTRWEDFVIALQWLYDYYPNGNEELLADTMLQLKYSGVPWDIVFLEEVEIAVLVFEYNAD